MNALSSRSLCIAVTLVILCGTLSAFPSDSSDKDGKLVVQVIGGDIDNTPAANVYVEAFGFVRKYRSVKSFVLKSSRPGQYEGALPPGVYDVFVSEGTSEPRCRRILIKPGLTSTWMLKLEIDEIYTEK